MQMSPDGSAPTRPATPRLAAGSRSDLDERLDTDLFRALADPTRATLFACLLKCGRACSVSELAECCEVDFSVVARHLTALARVGVVEAQKRGRTVWYTPRFEDLAERLRDLAESIEDCRPGEGTGPGTGCDPGGCGCDPSEKA